MFEEEQDFSILQKETDFLSSDILTFKIKFSHCEILLKNVKIIENVESSPFKTHFVQSQTDLKNKEKNKFESKREDSFSGIRSKLEPQKAILPIKKVALPMKKSTSQYLIENEPSEENYFEMPLHQISKIEQKNKPDRSQNENKVNNSLKRIKISENLNQLKTSYEIKSLENSLENFEIEQKNIPRKKSNSKITKVEIISETEQNDSDENQECVSLISNSVKDKSISSQSLEDLLFKPIKKKNSNSRIKPEPTVISPKIDEFQNLRKLRIADPIAQNHSYCPICYSEDMKNKAIIEKCAHSFCVNCIEEWAKQTNLCPLCKVKFNQISIFENEKFSRRQKIEDKKFVYEYMETSEDRIIQNADDFCYVCEKSDNENSLLICDHCLTKCCHIFCTKPKMRHIPEGDWFCDYCVRSGEVFPEYPIACIFGKNRRTNGR